MRQKCLFINCTDLNAISSKSATIGGIAVQLNLWAESFVNEGWKVITLTSADSYSHGNIEYYHYSYWGHFEILHELLVPFYFIVFRHADCILIRGASRFLFVNALLSLFFRRRLLFFGASDVDFTPGRERFAEHKLNICLYRKSLKYVSDFVVQNRNQHDSLLKYYKRESIVIPNIWKKSTLPLNQDTHFDVVWIANLRHLKRAEWLLSIARQCPHITFAMVGGYFPAIKDYYDAIEKEASLIDNINFFGKKSFSETYSILSSARLLLCTSEHEGFPNTFLQAWSCGIPVISSVDPNGFISDYGLGRVASSVDMFVCELQYIIDNQEVYCQCKDNVTKFFDEFYINGWNAAKLIKTLNL